MSGETERDLERERQYEAARQHRLALRPRRHTGAIALLVLVAILGCFALGVAALAYVVRNSSPGTAFSTLTDKLLGGKRSFIGAPVVVERIQRLNRLESVSYSVDTVVEGKRTNAVLPDLLFGDRLLLVVHGQVVAGVDLAQLKPENVKVDGDSVTVELPPSQVFTTRIDEGKSKVFARTTGLLVPADPNLETDTRRTAENQILQSAMQDGILDNARVNARNGIESLLRGLGFKTVSVR